MNKIYTKQGDHGKTSLLGGDIVTKYCERVGLYGDLDELNSWLGLIKALLRERKLENCEDIEVIQKNIFKISSLIALKKREHESKKLELVEVEDVMRLEITIDSISKDLPPLKDFVVPGSSPFESNIHIARTVCRRVERNTVKFYEIHKEEQYQEILSYLNRISDYLFVLSRIDFS